MSLRTPLPELRRKPVREAFSTIFLKSLFFVGVVTALGFASQRFFSWVAFDAATQEELFSKSLDGRLDVKSMAAAEWLRLLNEATLRESQAEALDALRPSSIQITKLSSLISRWVESCQAEEAPWLSSLVSVLGYAQPGTGSEDVLRRVLGTLTPSSPCESVNISALASLSRLGAKTPDDLSLSVKAAQSSDASLRKVAAFALGSFLHSNQVESSSTALQTLQKLLLDSTEDVRWNAVFALSKAQREEALPFLRELLMRAENAGSSSPSSEILTPTLFLVFQETFRASMRFHDAALHSQLEKLSRAHQNVKLRQAAKEAFESGTLRQ